jgi:predicted TIM-barrel fold metal-dependent hydrolase
MPDLIPFIDTHHHLWDLNRFSYEWLEHEDPDEAALIGDYAAIRQPYLIEDLLADFAGSNVVKAVHIQAEYTGPDPAEETQWLQGIADQHGYPHAIIAYTDLTAESAKADLEHHAEYANMRGIRNFVQGDDLLAPSFQRGMAALNELDLIYDLSTTWEGMDGAYKMAGLFPDLQIVLGHAGLPLERSDEYFADWKEAITRLAGAPNVVAKISGLGMADHDWTTDSIRPWVMGVIEAFGVERCMFATNWPVDKLFSSYQTVVDAYRTIISGLSPSEQNALMWENAERFYEIV